MVQMTLYQHVFQKLIIELHNIERKLLKSFPGKNHEHKWLISLKFVTDSPIDNAASLVQAMACQQTGEESLPQIVMTNFCDTYMHHKALID